MENKYFDLHIDGIAYLNRARSVQVKRGSFLAVDLSALRGEAAEVEYTRFDCRVSGSEAQQLVQEFMDQINDENRKVLVGFRAGDLYAETFTFSKGEKAGSTGVSLKARLLKIKWIKVDGETVYTAPAAAPIVDAAESA
jgi:Protein of unknown function (DUF3577).